MATYYTLLTKIGQARIANAVALNQKVNLTYMAVGDGNGNPTTPNENQTALVREKYRATINQLTVDPDNPNYLVAEMIVPTNVGGWSIYEVGVFDDQNQLIAVANFPATYKPELVEGSGRDLIVRIIIQVSNTSVVTLKIDPAITLASQAWVAANYVKKITVAGGTTGQILAKKSNANEDFQWVDPTAAVDVNVFSREETQTVATSQTIIDLAQLTTDGAAIYIEGIRLRDDQFTVNSATRLTLATSYPAGTKVTIVQNEETSRNAFMLKANNLSDVQSAATARANLGLSNAIIGDTCKEAGFYLGSALAPYLMHEDTHTAIRLVTLDSVHRVTTSTYTINYYANGLIQILGVTPTVSSLVSPTLTFPVAFPTACIRFALHNRESGVPSYNMAMYSNLSRTGAKIWGVANILGNSGSPTLGALPDAEISYEAWGY